MMTGFLVSISSYNNPKTLAMFCSFVPKLAQQKKIWNRFMHNIFLRITDFVLEIRAGC